MSDTTTIPSLSDDQAKEYDYILVLDKSGSMGSPSTKMEGKTRWQEAQEFTESFARFADLHDDDGLTVITFNSTSTVYDGVHADKVHDVFTTCQPGGSTNLAGALAEAYKKKAASTKKAIVVVLTDGSPDSQTAVKDGIIAEANALETDDGLSIQFVQIGDDNGAAAFLKMLDDDLQSAGAKFDIVNTLTREQAEGLTIEQLLYEAIND